MESHQPTNQKEKENELVLVTGGAGYIGSHTVVELLQVMVFLQLISKEGYPVVVVDNLCNSSSQSLKKIEEITGKTILGFHKVDICDEAALDKVFETYQGKIKSVIHFAGLKAVGESVQKPCLYYTKNVAGTLSLIRVMAKHKVKTIVFSSSATVYGNVEDFPEGGLYEGMPIGEGPTSPYGKTKYYIENILSDVQKSDAEWDVALLRYFNPAGAHPSGLIGEDPNGIPNNLVPFILQVALGKQPMVRVFGNDYKNTPDGTGLRDYIHVVDLAKGHIAALRYLREKHPGLLLTNLGTGKGSTVLEMIEAMKIASGKEIPFKVVERRPGDVAILVACPKKANGLLNWKANIDIVTMCKDAWNWQSKNPNGFTKDE